jgi:D-alanine-D-alanine ligase-like ATP-grasp enzyme
LGIPKYVPAGDADVLAFAKRIAGVFGGIPLLGIDIVREHGSGKLYALEVNAGGNVWHFSSPYWAERRARYPHVARAMHEQFGAFDVAAKALISATRRLAS